MTKFEGIKNYKNDLEFEFITNEEEAIENSKEILERRKRWKKGLQSDFQLNEEDLNTTETRALYRQLGVFFPRDIAHEDMETYFNDGRNTNTTQLAQREKTQSFVERNWEYLKNVAEAYGCTGDCASSSNLCTDARASNCYLECFPSKRRKRR